MKKYKLTEDCITFLVFTFIITLASPAAFGLMFWSIEVFTWSVRILTSFYIFSIFYVLLVFFSEGGTLKELRDGYFKEVSDE